MTENEARARVRQAIGEIAPPAGLEARAYRRLREIEPSRDRVPRAAVLVAVAITTLVLVTLVGIRSTSLNSRQPVPAATPMTTAAPTSTPLQPQFSAALLSSAGLAVAANLVTPLQLDATDQGVTIRLVGAYADHARTVVLFQSSGPGVPVRESLEDSKGPVNFSSGSRTAPAPYSSWSLDGPPTVDSDGLAHLRLTVAGYQERIGAAASSTPPSTLQGLWEFRFTLGVQPGQPLLPPDISKQVGTVPVMLELVEATPAVIHVQALIQSNGQAILTGAGAGRFLQLIDSSGHAVQPVAAGAGVTAPKQQLTQQTADVVRLNYQWERPATGGTYEVRLTYQDATASLMITVPSTPA